jgi:CheY-like chemotaxis protein
MARRLVAYLNTELARKLSLHLQRVLIIDPIPASGRLLAELLRDLGAQRISIQPGNLAAQAVLDRIDPQIVFTELNGPALDGFSFTRALRRSASPCRRAPVIVVSAVATAPAILGARAAGVHEFLRKPFTINDLVRRVDAAALRGRDWIEGVHYVGPDRRRFNSGDHCGPLNRRSTSSRTPHEERLMRALQILRSALAAIAADPHQALRAMKAQAVELRKIASATSSDALATAAFGFMERLPSDASALVQDDLDAAAEPLWAFMPKVETSADVGLDMAS